MDEDLRSERPSRHQISGVILFPLLPSLLPRLRRIHETLTRAEELRSRRTVRGLRQDERRLTRLPRNSQTELVIRQPARYRVDLKDHIRDVLLPRHERLPDQPRDLPNRGTKRRPFWPASSPEPGQARQAWRVHLQGRRHHPPPSESTQGGSPGVHGSPQPQPAQRPHPKSGPERKPSRTAPRPSDAPISTAQRQPEPASRPPQGSGPVPPHRLESYLKE